MSRQYFSAKLLAPVLLAVLAASGSCTSRTVAMQEEAAGGATQPDTVAGIVTDESGTTMNLIQFDEQDTDVPAMFVLGSWTVDIGGMNFAIDQGYVPEGSTSFPSVCKGRTDLGPDAAVGCLYQPLLGLTAENTSGITLPSGDISVVLSYGTNSDETYPLALTESFDQKITDGISERMGFKEEPEMDILEAAANADLQGYYHDTAAPLSQPDWMKNTIPLNRKLSELSLPGTHDSVSNDPNQCGPIAKTQSMSLEEQLASGIRAFDIRLKCKDTFWSFSDGAMSAFHGICSMKLSLDEILTTMTKFLDNHPGEALLVQVKNENYDSNTCQNGKLFWDVFGNYYDRYRGRIWEPTGNEDPTFKEIKGKIVIMQNIAGTPYEGNSEAKYGLKWPGVFYGHIQDDFHLFDNWSLYNKWIGESDVRFMPFSGKHWKKTFVFGGVKRSLEATKNGGRGYINYLSGSVGSFPYFVAGGRSSPQTNAPRLWTGIAGAKSKKDGKYPDFEHRYYGTQKTPQVSIYFVGINDLTANWLKNNKPGYSGIIYADFPGRDLITEIIGVNARYKPLQDQCFGLPDLTPCYLPDATYKYNICKQGTCVKPSSCDHKYSSSGPYFQLPPAFGYHFTKNVPVAGQPVVTDTVTGLVWQGCAAGKKGDTCDIGDFEYKNQKEALEYCDKLEWGGQKPWRLPDRYELMSIVDYGSRKTPMIDSYAFPNSPDWGTNYQTSMISSSCSYNDAAWIVNLNRGSVEHSSYYTPNDTRHPVRCVRGDKPSIGRRFSHTFLINDQPIIYDHVTRLLWQGCAAGETGVGCASGKSVQNRWVQANAYCSSLEWGGLKGWRLPNVQELASLVDDRYNPAIEPAAFLNSANSGGMFWSSTPRYPGEDSMYLVLFHLGEVGSLWGGKNGWNRTRCVQSDNP